MTRNEADCYKATVIFLLLLENGQAKRHCKPL